MYISTSYICSSGTILKEGIWSKLIVGYLSGISSFLFKVLINGHVNHLNRHLFHYSVVSDNLYRQELLYTNELWHVLSWRRHVTVWQPNLGFVILRQGLDPAPGRDRSVVATSEPHDVVVRPGVWPLTFEGVLDGVHRGDHDHLPVFPQDILQGGSRLVLVFLVLLCDPGTTHTRPRGKVVIPTTLGVSGRTLLDHPLVVSLLRPVILVLSVSRHHYSKGPRRRQRQQRLGGQLGGERVCWRPQGDIFQITPEIKHERKIFNHIV